jgi:hypothetical protein
MGIPKQSRRECDERGVVAKKKSLGYNTRSQNQKERKPA